jgi:glycosyltransferase involved in cell wall biosynthesis
MKDVEISVIVPTKNEAKNIERCLKSITGQTFTQYECIVVDNNSSDATVALAKKYTDLVFTAGPERSSQRNFGAKHAQGKFVLFIDADMELQPDVLEACLFTAGKTTNIGGIIIPEIPIGYNFFEKVKAFERSLYNKYGDETTDAARFFPKKIFIEVGGYDVTITGPEDWDLPETIKKKGYEITRVKAQIMHYERIPSVIDLFRKKFYYAKKAHRYLAKQQIPAVSSKTIYFLRPIFYKSWKEYIAHPVLFLGMLFMLSGELVAGGTGFLLGKMKQL